jgi:hypothetical protein
MVRLTSCQVMLENEACFEGISFFCIENFFPLNSSLKFIALLSEI